MTAPEIPTVSLSPRHILQVHCQVAQVQDFVSDQCLLFCPVADLLCVVSVSKPQIFLTTKIYVICIEIFRF